MEYRGYTGSSMLDTESGWSGKILNITDLVTYKAYFVWDIRNEFEAAVDDWLETREELSRADRSSQ